MKKLSALLLQIIVSALVTSVATPVFALGDCGPNRHRDGRGHCVFGGQNQAWCLRHTGHVAANGPGGTKWGAVR